MAVAAENLQGGTVLVVDDERTVCESVAKVLRRLGLAVEQETSVAGAVVRLAGGERYNLIVVDLMMPETGGVELLKMVRESWPDTVTLVITGYASIESAVETARLGAAGYLPKPFTPEELVDAVVTAMDGRRGKVLPFEELPAAGQIDVDMPFDAREVARATSVRYVEHLGRSDMPLVEPAPVPPLDFCALGQRNCKRFAKKGVCQQDECPIVVNERKKQARTGAATPLVADPIDVDLPFSAAEVEAATSPAYVAALGRSDLPIVGHWRDVSATGAPRVLVVDDEAVVLNSVRRTLVRRGLEVEEAFSAREALARLAGGDYALVLLDMRLPDANGIELLGRIRRERPGLPVVIVTGYASVDTAATAIRSGASDYLAKPFTPDELYRVAQRALDRAA